MRGGALIRKKNRPAQRWYVLVLSACAALALAVASCGGDDEDGGGEGGSTRITVQETAGVPSAFVAFGIEQGFFQDEGLEIDLEEAEGGAATLPALVNGDVQIAGSNVVSLLLGGEQGLPIRIIAPGTSAVGERDEDFAALIVPEGSSIERAQDLEGSTVAINTLDNIAELVVRESLEQEGVDSSRVRFIEVPFPEMGPVIEGGDADAAFSIEPFLTQSLEQGAEVINYSYVVTEPNLQVGAYAVTQQYADENLEVIEGYSAAIAENAEYITKNEDEFRTFLSERAGIPPEAAEQIALPVFTPELDVESLELTASLMEEYEISEEEPDVSALVQGEN